MNALTRRIIRAEQKARDTCTDGPQWIVEAPPIMTVEEWEAEYGCEEWRAKHMQGWSEK